MIRLEAYVLIGKHSAAQYKDAYDLSVNRKHITSEMHMSNDFYGHATIFREYLGELFNQCSATFEHGFFYPSGKIWSVDDLNSP